MDIIFIFALGILAGLVTAWIIKPRPMGRLRIDHSDPDGPYLFLEIKVHPDEIMRRKEVIFEVKAEDFISRK